MPLAGPEGPQQAELLMVSRISRYDLYHFYYLLSIAFLVLCQKMPSNLQIFY
jgi:hypothetical protein